MGLAGIDSRVESIEASGAITWMRRVLAALEGGAAGRLERRQLGLAGVALDLRFDDAALATDYTNIMFAGDAADVLARERIYVLTSTQSLALGSPKLDQARCSPDAFQAFVRANGFLAAYPFQRGTWKFYDPALKVGVQITETRDTLPLWDATAPLRQHLHWLFDERDERLAHAATLGLNGKGIVLFGAGGAGKSGTTLAGLAAGLNTVGDDYVALSAGVVPMARPLFRVVKQDRSGLARLPELKARTAHIEDNWRGKVMFDPSSIYEGAFVDALELAAVVLPHIAHSQEPMLRPAKGREAMLALMTSNLHQFPGEADKGMAFFARLLAKVPSYHLELSPDAGKNGALLKRFIASDFTVVV